METELREQICPCESGFSFNDCCGDSAREGPNQIASLMGEGVATSAKLSAHIQTTLQTLDLNPDWFPARINFAARKAWLVKMSPRWYRESVFLDPERIKGSCVVETDLAWLASASKTATWQPTAFIFHTAFCGSTLMAQALDAIFNCLPLREPEALGNLLLYARSNAEEREKSVWRDRVLQLLSRRYASRQGVVVKANDYANPLMLDLSKWRGDIPILFMYTPLNEFVVGCLKADNRRQWIAGRYQSIAKIIPDYLTLPASLQVRDDAFAEMAAIYWSYNIALYNKAHSSAAEQLRSLDFNRMLAEPKAAVLACGALFGLHDRADINADEQIDGLFGVYSKNSKFKYSPQQRNADIMKLLTTHQAANDVAEQLARQLLGQAYPEQGLPGALHFSTNN